MIESIPTLGFQGEFLVVSSHEGGAEFRFGDITDHAYTLEHIHLILHGERDSEEEFIVFSAVQGTCGEVHVELFGCDGGLIVDRYVLLEDAASAPGLFADVHQF